MSPTRKTLNFEEKNKIIIMLEDGIHSSVICKEYGISKRTLFRIKKSSESLKQNFNKTCKNKKRFRKSRYEDINNYVEKVVKDCNEAYIPINFEMLKCIAEKYAKENKITQFKGSNGWLCSLKKNKLLSTVCVVGETGSADVNSSNDFLNNTMPSVIKEYDKNNIFNLDETGLFYKLLPNRTVKLKGKRITGLKQSKERIIVCFLVNENGEKFPLLILGKSANPRCFKNFNLSTLNIIYKHNKNAWVTLKILSEYLSYINEELAKIKRNILIIMDNCPAHKNLENFSNIRILFLPPNTTSLIQPLDHGIIRAFKANYKKGFISNIFSHNNFKDFTKNLKRYSILDAIFNVVSAFNKLEVSTFQNCFKCLYRTNILIDYEENNTLKEVTEYSETFEQFQENLDHSYGWSEYLDYDNFKNVHKEVVNELAKEVKVAHLQNISKVNLFYEEKQKLFNYLEEIKNLTIKFAPESILTLIEFENKVKDELNKK